MDASCRVLVIEDSDSESAVLCRYLNRYSSEHELALTVTRLSSALDFDASTHPADLIFMDIDLPGESGMEAAEMLREVDTETPLVFVTNLAQYAVHGYAVNAVGFLVKSCSYGDFALCMARAMRDVERDKGQSLVVNTHDGIRVIPIRELVWVEVSAHELAYHLSDGTSFQARGTMLAQEKELAESGAPFVRVSASSLANMAHLRHVTGQKLLMSDGEVLYLSRGKRKAALASIADYLGGSA